MKQILAVVLVLSSTSLVVGDETVAAPEVDFAGSWETAYGELRLTQKGQLVEGRYDSGTVRGIVDGRVLELRYQEAGVEGEAKFTLSEDGQSFEGVWRADGSTTWAAWNGRRTEVTPLGFDGLWQTSFGAMRLTRQGDDVRGAYDYASGSATIEGQIKEDRLIFRYKEPEIEGSGWFELSEDQLSFNGQWRPDGQQQWSSWTGKRKVPVPGRVWLVILEANWETSIEEPEYAFGDMLDNYFTMAAARHVQVRHRFFHDAKDLRRFSEKIQFIAEPVVLLISTHGTKDGITVFGETITADVIAESLVGADNIKLLHLSGCGMMSGDFPDQIHTRLKESVKFPISGYKTSVAWDASAIGDFTFLSLLLIRGMEPDEAVEQAVKVAPFLGEQRRDGSAFAPLGLSVKMPP